MAVLSGLRGRGRVVVLVTALAVAGAGLWSLWRSLVEAPAGEILVRDGEHHLSGGAFAEAVEDFDRALAGNPGHHRALLGKAAALIRLQRLDEADQVLTHAIETLRGNLDPADPAGRGALAAAYGNRGVVRDRQARYDQALTDYIESLKIDAETVDAPGFLDALRHDGQGPRSIRARADYLYKQLQLPEDQRRLRLPR